MKKFTVLAIVAFLTISLSLSAQNNNTRRGWSAKERADLMTKELKLSAEQSDKVKALFEKLDEEQAKQMAEIRAKGNDLQNDREAFRKKMQELRAKTQEENDAKVEAIIGKEKMKAWKDIRAKRQESMRDANRSGRRAPETSK